MIQTRWNQDQPGIHVFQVFPILDNARDSIGPRIQHVLSKLENPVLALINLKPRPKRDFSHVVDSTRNPKINRAIVITNALKKYPNTESILIEGGMNITLFSGTQFEGE